MTGFYKKKSRWLESLTTGPDTFVEEFVALFAERSFSPFCQFFCRTGSQDQESGQHLFLALLSNINNIAPSLTFSITKVMLRDLLHEIVSHRFRPK